VDVRRLKVFCNVVELKSFTKAAKASFLTQPSVSDHIRVLEENLGEKLLPRLPVRFFTNMPAVLSSCEMRLSRPLINTGAVFQGTWRWGPVQPRVPTSFPN